MNPRMLCCAGHNVVTIQFVIRGAPHFSHCSDVTGGHAPADRIAVTASIVVGCMGTITKYLEKGLLNLSRVKVCLCLSCVD